MAIGIQRGGEQSAGRTDVPRAIARGSVVVRRRADRAGRAGLAWSGYEKRVVGLTEHTPACCSITRFDSALVVPSTYLHLLSSPPAGGEE